MSTHQEREMTPAYTAYATTSDSMPGADAGITIFTVTTEDGHQVDGDAVAETVTTQLDSDDLSAGDTHLLDEGAADDMLARMGYERRGQWVEAGGQWAAEVAAGRTKAARPTIRGAYQTVT